MLSASDFHSVRVSLCARWSALRLTCARMCPVKNNTLSRLIVPTDQQPVFVSAGTSSARSRTLDRPVRVLFASEPTWGGGLHSHLYRLCFTLTDYSEDEMSMSSSSSCEPRCWCTGSPAAACLTSQLVSAGLQRRSDRLKHRRSWG